jgi:uncharacterized protein
VLAGTDMILHAGDIVGRLVLERLEEKGALAVCGNMDDHEIAGLVPQVRMIDAGGLKIALIHGWGSKVGLEERIVERLSRENPDLIVYGHTHVPFWGRVQGVRLFNPGSASYSNYMGSGTVGLIEIRDGELTGKIVSLKDEKSPSGTRRNRTNVR